MLACGSRLCRVNYQSRAQQARIRMLWQKARLTLRMPSRQWMQHSQPEHMTRQGAPGTVNADGISSYWLDMLLATLDFDWKTLHKQFLEQCFKQCVSVSYWVWLLRDLPGQLSQQDRSLLTALLQDSERYCTTANSWTCHYDLSRPSCRHGSLQSLQDICLVHIMPHWLLHTLVASDPSVAAATMGIRCCNVEYWDY